MPPEFFRTHARYNRWMNAKVYDAAARLTDEARKQDRNAFFSSIHNVLNHLLLVADRIWLGRVAGVVPEPGFIGEGITELDQELAVGFEELRREREKTDAAIDAWVDTLTEESLAGTLRMIRRGQPYECPLWWVAAQVFNHQTHHRGQLTTLLFQAGQDPGATDLFAMLVEEGQGA